MKAIKKLSNHLIDVHKITNAARRRALLAEAAKLGAQAPSTMRVQISIKESFEKSSSTPTLITRQATQRGTRSYPFFSIDSETLLQDFVANIMSFDGGSKSGKEAREVAVDVSKVLAYVDPKKATWNSLLK